MKKPDPVLVKDQLQAIQAMLKAWGPQLFAMQMFWILTKQELAIGKNLKSILIPFRFNSIQEILYKNVARNNLLVKPRQIGGTVWFLLMRLFLPAITKPGTGSLLVSHRSQSVHKIFMIAHRAYRYIGAVDPFDFSKNQLCLSLKQNVFHTKYASRSELYFDQLDSHLLVDSAEVEEAGQSFSLMHVLADEFSRWPHDPEATLSNIRGALVQDGSGTVDKNCTANGAAGPFFEDCMRALHDPANSDAKLFFFGWWHASDYTIRLSEEEKDTMEANFYDMLSGNLGKAKQDQAREELRIIKLMHKELSDVAWTGSPSSRVFVP